MTDLSTLWLFLLRPWRLNSVIYPSVRVQAWLAKIWNSTISYDTWGNSMSKRWKKYVELQIGPRRRKKALEIPCQNAGTCPGNPHLSKKKTSPDFPRCSQACCLGLGFLVTCQLSQRIRGLSTTWDGNMGIPWNIQDANKLP